MQASDAIIGPINLGTLEEQTMLALAERIRALTGSRSELAYHPKPCADPIRRRPDIKLATRLVAWHR